jgi:hypothetical protein
MPRPKWRTVSCADDSLRTHNSEQAVYRWVAQQPAGTRYRLQIDEGYGWQNVVTVVPNGNGTTDEEA